MRFSVLSSGSKANAIYIEGPHTRILLDCGLSARQVTVRLAELGIDASKLDAILVSHEHSDHIFGVPTLSKRLKVPVYVNRPTAKHLRPCYAFEFFETGQPFSFGDFQIVPFSIPHDASDPVGFSFCCEGLKFSVATDLGRVTPLVEESLRGSHALVLESNHDEEMLRNCGYPWVLKQRILSSHGHLSNETAGSLLRELIHSDLLHVVLGHLSENSNTPLLALDAAQRHLGDRQPPVLTCGSVSQATRLFRVGDVNQPSERLAV